MPAELQRHKLAQDCTQKPVGGCRGSTLLRTDVEVPAVVQRTNLAQDWTLKH